MLQTSNLLRQKLCLHAQDAKEDIEPKSVYNQRDGCDYQRIHPKVSKLQETSLVYFSRISKL